MYTCGRLSGIGTHGTINSTIKKIWYDLVVKLAIKIIHNSVSWRVIEIEINNYLDVWIIFLSITIAYGWIWNKSKGNLYFTTFFIR